MPCLERFEGRKSLFHCPCHASHAGAGTRHAMPCYAQFPLSVLCTVVMPAAYAVMVLRKLCPVLRELLMFSAHATQFAATLYRTQTSSSHLPFMLFAAMFFSTLSSHGGELSASFCLLWMPEFSFCSLLKAMPCCCLMHVAAISILPVSHR